MQRIPPTYHTTWDDPDDLSDLDYCTWWTTKMPRASMGSKSVVVLYR